MSEERVASKEVLHKRIDSPDSVVHTLWQWCSNVRIRELVAGTWLLLWCGAYSLRSRPCICTGSDGGRLPESKIPSKFENMDQLWECPRQYLLGKCILAVILHPTLTVVLNPANIWVRHAGRAHEVPVVGGSFLTVLLDSAST